MRPDLSSKEGSETGVLDPCTAALCHPYHGEHDGLRVGGVWPGRAPCHPCLFRGLRVEDAWPGRAPCHPCLLRGLRVEGAWPGRAPCRSWSVLWAGAPSHTTPDQGSQGGGRRCWLASRSPPQYLVVTHPTQHEENTISSWQGRHRVFFKNSESWRSVSYLNGVLGVWKRHIGIQKHKSFSCLVSACVFLTTSSIILICRAL